jgi:hypothetical protein
MNRSVVKGSLPLAVAHALLFHLMRQPTATEAAVVASSPASLFTAVPPAAAYPAFPASSVNARVAAAAGTRQSGDADSDGATRGLSEASAPPAAPPPSAPGGGVSPSLIALFILIPINIAAAYLIRRIWKYIDNGKKDPPAAVGGADNKDGDRDQGAGGPVYATRVDPQATSSEAVVVVEAQEAQSAESEPAGMGKV